MFKAAIILIGIFTIVPAAFSLISSSPYSEGERYGNVTKISKKGIFCKSWEGELFTQAKGAQSTMMGNSFLFSITDEKVVEKVKESSTNATSVALVYEEKYFLWPCTTDTKYIVVDVK